MALGWWLTMPGDYERQTRLMLFATAFFSNIPFGDQRGYFEAAAHTKPLLHTWSLSIEWQFYALLPLLLMGIWQASGNRSTAFRHKAVVAVLIGLIALSLLWNVHINSKDAGAAFFSLRARAWELVAGGLIAALLRWVPVTDHRYGKALCISAGWTGWTMVLLTAMLSLPAASWPGMWTVLPVGGACLIIAAGPLGAMTRIAQCSPVQRLGDWSYAIYLWHWPLWVFLQQWANYRGIALGFQYTAALLVASVLAGFLSYRWIESPTRKRQGPWTTKRLWLGYGACLAALTLFTLGVVASHGFPGRVPAYQQRVELARRTNTPRDECFRNARSEKTAPEEFCEFGAMPGTQAASMVLWGDSVANQFLDPLTVAARQTGTTGLIATQTGCRALFAQPAGNPSDFAGCDRFNEKMLAYLSAKPQLGIVILGRNWGDNAGSVKEALTLVQRLLAMDKTVVLILPMLSMTEDVPAVWFREQLRAGHAVDTLQRRQTPELIFQVARDVFSTDFGSLLKNPHFITIDLLPQLCQNGYCDLVANGQANFRDTLHISNLNASRYNAAFTNAISAAVKAQGDRATSSRFP
jgi:peptidoglycan/LPS O-acetylase OafA/YrhL